MRKEISRYLRILIPLAILFYLVPIIAVLFVACGLLDIARHRRVTRDLAKQYFFRNGLPTWLLSPFNLFLAGGFSKRPPGGNRTRSQDLR